MPVADEAAERMYGFHRALLRFRRAVFLGWTLAAAGVIGLLLRWEARPFVGLLDILLSGLVVVAGVVLVSQAVEFLSAYARTLFMSAAAGAARTELDKELDELARTVEAGGWQEAFAAVDRIRSIAERHGLPAMT